MLFAVSMRSEMCCPISVAKKKKKKNLRSSSREKNPLLHFKREQRSERQGACHERAIRLKKKKENKNKNKRRKQGGVYKADRSKRQTSRKGRGPTRKDARKKERI